MRQKKKRLNNPPRFPRNYLLATIRPPTTPPRKTVAAAVVVAVAVVAVVVEDPYEPGGILKTDPILPKSGVPCRGTEELATCEGGSRGRGVERTAALCGGKAASVDGGIGLGEGTAR